MFPLSFVSPKLAYVFGSPQSALRRTLTTEFRSAVHLVSLCTCLSIRACHRAPRRCRWQMPPGHFPSVDREGLLRASHGRPWRAIPLCVGAPSRLPGEAVSPQFKPHWSGALCSALLGTSHLLPAYVLHAKLHAKHLQHLLPCGAPATGRRTLACRPARFLGMIAARYCCRRHKKMALGRGEGGAPSAHMAPPTRFRSAPWVCCLVSRGSQRPLALLQTCLDADVGRTSLPSHDASPGLALRVCLRCSTETRCLLPANACSYSAVFGAH